MRCEGPFICFLTSFCLLPLRCAVAIACAAHCFSRSNTPRGTLCVDVIGSGLLVVEIFLIQQSVGRWKIIFVFQKRYWRWHSSRREKPYMRWDASFQPINKTTKSTPKSRTQTQWLVSKVPQDHCNNVLLLLIMVNNILVSRKQQ